MKKSRFLLVLIGAIVISTAGILLWRSHGLHKRPGKKAASTTESIKPTARAEAELDEIRRADAALPTSERLSAWELDFRGEVLSVAHGHQCFYYLLHLPNSYPDAPGRKGALPVVSANLDRSDWRFAVVCLDLKTGQIRWSREVSGLVYLAVGSGSDVLYLYRERIVALAPDSGNVFQELDLPNRGRGIQGLLLNGRILTPQPHASNPPSADAQFALYDVAAKSVVRVNAADYWLLSPDERRRLVRRGSAWDCLEIADGRKLWSATSLGDGVWQPLWYARDALFTQGTERQRGVITAVDCLTGEPHWAATLGWGLYESAQHQLRGGGYPDLFRPLSELDKQLLALDGSGRLYFLDSANGLKIASVRLDRHYLEMPFQFGGQLIVCSFDWIRSYSLATLLAPESSAHARLQLRKLRCLLDLGRAKEALAVIDGLVARAPQLKAAWDERADVCKITGDLEEEIFSRCQALSMSNQTTNEYLHSRCGLMRLYHLDGKPCWPLAVVEGEVYAGTLDGGLWSVRANSLDLGLVARLDHEVAALKTKPELQAVLGNSTANLRTVPQGSDRPDARIPREWYTEGGAQRIGKAVEYHGRQFRPMRGGVRILSGIELKDVVSPLKDLGPWSLHLSPFGSLGFGAGVFELDENLCPIRWLIRPRVAGETAEGGETVSLACSSKSIGLVVVSSKGAALQAYSREGVLQNEASLGPYPSGWAQQQLIPFESGFLFSDRQLVWIGAGADHRVWRFGPSLSRTSMDRSGDRWRYFGNPLVVQGCLYVTGLDGHLYVFDTAQITRGDK